MKKIGLITKTAIAKVEKTLNFADGIISVENKGLDSSLYGQRALYDRLEVLYLFNSKKYTTNISSQWGTTDRAANI